MGPTLRKDDSCDITLAINLSYLSMTTSLPEWRDNVYKRLSLEVHKLLYIFLGFLKFFLLFQLFIEFYNK